ncbi:hypothetical protein [Falsiruegeria litorea]|uniref:Uncharacterized protein n=1 Tax=Falsiruegeria litorea TaxID=1280831 RepID=A0ABS5WV25_9RHOB|nr:hypothetical protein [Falsiruegeria litorea]MBT3142920.1 hypothetical protein [Falsiruegeria litorea]MBT8169616.1 hypothetical protein [Falsiruegeria litorea]
MSIIDVFNGVIPDENDPDFNSKMRAALSYILGMPSQFNSLKASEFFQVMSDAIDATEGRLMPVGAFGLGATDEALTRLDVGNGPLASGFYSGSGAAADAATFPVAGARSHPFLNLTRRKSEGSFDIRRMFFDDLNPIIWGSNDSGATWGAANTLYGTENLLGTVAMSGGKPTGAVFEYGANANGYYLRVANGVQVCWRRNWGIGPGATVWTFPAVFSGGQGSVAVIGSATSAATARTVSGISSSYQDATIQLRDHSNAAVAGGVSLLAIGLGL